MNEPKVNIVEQLGLVTRVVNLITNYANRVVNAPTSYKKVFGTKVATVWEVKREFTSQLKELAELAVLVGDKEALDLCQAQVNADETAVKETAEDIKNLSIPE